MPDLGRVVNSSNFNREVLAAWVVVLVTIAIAVLLLLFDEPRTDHRIVPRWHKPPVAVVDEWDGDLSSRPSADWVLPQSGSSTAPYTTPDAR